jgi:hypothetical protein
MEVTDGDLSDPTGNFLGIQTPSDVILREITAQQMSGTAGRDR